MKITLKKALKNEIQKQLYRNPTDAELQLINESINEFISDLEYDNKRIYLSTWVDAISYAIKENFRECAACGEFVLRSEFNPYENEYCLNCKGLFDPEAMPGGWEDLQSRD